MIFPIILTLFTVFVGSASILLTKVIDQQLLIILGLLFIISVFIEKKYPKVRFLQIVILVAFHWVSQLNWCLSIYYTLIVKEFSYQKNFKYIIFYSLSVGILYTSIRLTYATQNVYSYLVSVLDLISIVAISLFINYLLKLKKDKNELEKRNEVLIKYDVLTGLLNYQSFYTELNAIINKRIPFQLILIDCNNFTEYNRKMGIKAGNEILKVIAKKLQEEFHDALMIARYGGDEFALILNRESRFNKELLQQQLLHELSIQTTLGIARFPIDAVNIDELITCAEDNIYEMKREVWLKREEVNIQKEKLALVGELAAGLAHEIRNPITTVKGLLQISKRNQYDISEWYEILMDEISRVNQLTVEFLQFSKPHANQIKVIDLKECIEKVRNLMFSEAALNGHKFICHSEANIYSLIDQEKFTQVLINLVKNALEAMVVPGVVSITLVQKESYACIEIEDNGIGMSSAEVKSIFNPFYTTKEEGTGLGLPISRKIIEDHHGSVIVESEKGRGTKFTILVPISSD